MIADGDRILVALSGGKDSFTMLDTLRRLQDRAPVDFSLSICTVHPGFPGFTTSEITQWLEANGYEHIVEQSSIYEEIFSDPQMALDGCFHCSRQRRSVLYRVASRLGCNKIALGHHKDDFIETVLLSMFYNGKIETMLPVFESESRQVRIIRPLFYVAEETTRKYATSRSFPVTCCRCPLCCGVWNSRRKKVKKMLLDFSRDDPQVKGSLLSSLSHFSAPFMLDLRFNEALKGLIEEGSP